MSALAQQFPYVPRESLPRTASAVAVLGARHDPTVRAAAERGRTTLTGR
jgi:hypothetical protein